MGCGASSTVTVPAADAVNSHPKRDADLPNGHVNLPAVSEPANKNQSFKNTSKSNIVSPAPRLPNSASSSPEPCEVSESGDVLTVKRILKLSSIDETQVYGAKQNVSCQTSHHRWRKRLVDQKTQTEGQLFPEDELVLMTCDGVEDEENHFTDPDFWDDSDMHEVNDKDSTDKEFRSCRRPSSGMNDVFTQTRSWACSTSTQTKISLTATFAARQGFAASWMPRSDSPVRGEGHRDRAKRLPVIATPEVCDIGDETSVISSKVLCSYPRASSGKCPNSIHSIFSFSQKSDSFQM